MHLKVARAWTLKERFHPFWDYTYRGTAQTCFAAGSGAQPTVAWRRWWQSPLLIRRHLPNVLTDLRHSITNAGVEALNATIQWVKKTARCFRNVEHFKAAIYSIVESTPTHTKS